MVLGVFGAAIYILQRNVTRCQRIWKGHAVVLPSSQPHMETFAWAHLAADIARRVSIKLAFSVQLQVQSTPMLPF